MADGRPSLCAPRRARRLPGSVHGLRLAAEQERALQQLITAAAHKHFKSRNRRRRRGPRRVSRRGQDGSRRLRRADRPIRAWRAAARCSAILEETVFREVERSRLVENRGSCGMLALVWPGIAARRGRPVQAIRGSAVRVAELRGGVPPGERYGAEGAPLVARQDRSQFVRPVSGISSKANASVVIRFSTTASTSITRTWRVALPRTPARTSPCGQPAGPCRSSAKGPSSNFRRRERLSRHVMRRPHLLRRQRKEVPRRRARMHVGRGARLRWARLDQRVHAG